MRSTDGIDWQTVDVADPPGGSVDVISRWSGRFIMAGVDGPVDAPHAALWTSDDGRSWQGLPDSAVLGFGTAGGSGRSASIAMVDAVDDRIVAVGEIWPNPCHEGCDGPLAVFEWTSIDSGQSWTRRKLAPELQNHDPAVHIGDTWVRVSQYWDAFETSTDNEHWETASLPVDGYYMPQRVRLTSFGVVAVGAVGDNDAGLVLNSTDGATWIQSTGWPDLEQHEGINDVAGNEATLVAIGFIYSGSTPKAYVFVSPPLN